MGEIDYRIQKHGFGGWVDHLRCGTDEERAKSMLLEAKRGEKHRPTARIFRLVKVTTERVDV